MKQHFPKSAGTKVSAVFFAAALVLPSMSVAEEVTLSSYDGSTQLAGELLAYEDGRYRLKTELGTLLISANVVMCDGAECPAQETVLADLLMAGDIELNGARKTLIAPSN